MKHCLFVAMLVLAGCDAQAPEPMDSSAVTTPTKPSLSALDMHGDTESDKAEALLAQVCPALTNAQQAGEIVSLMHHTGVPESETLQMQGWKRSISIDVVMADHVRSIDVWPSPDGQHCKFELGAQGFVSHKRVCLAICDAAPPDDGEVYRLLPVANTGLHLPAVSTDYAVTPIADVLDIDALRRQMKLGVATIEHYEDGHIRYAWSIRQPSGIQSQIQIKGFDLHDADSVSWNCSEFDAKGARLDPAREGSFCADYFQRVLGMVVAQPKALASEMLKRSSAVERSWVQARTGNFAVETNGDSYYIRHQVPL